MSDLIEPDLAALADHLAGACLDVLVVIDGEGEGAELSTRMIELFLEVDDFLKKRFVAKPSSSGPPEGFNDPKAQRARLRLL